MALLSLSEINKSFDSRQVLKNINLNISQGEFVSLVGVSGSGKSTLLNIIAGLEKTDSGLVLLNGESLNGKTGKVSYMFQKDLLFPYYTILDNVILPLIISGMKKEDAQKKAEPFFAQFGLEGTQQKYPKQLSGGMKQRAAFLRTYLSSKELMLLDEPFSALDMITKNQMHEWYLNVMSKLKLTTLLITHDIEEAILLSDRIFIMNNVNSNEASNVINEIKVELPFPRNMDLCYTEEFNRLKKMIFAKL